MDAPEVLVVRTGTANLASVLAGLRRAGASPRLTEDPAEVSAAERVVLPGVGTLAAAMAQLEQRGLVPTLRSRIEAGRPTLAICLGLQMLCEGSEESPGLAGLGVVPGVVGRFPDDVRVPQLGWNSIRAGAGCELLADGYVYFANSFRLEQTPDGWGAASCEYGGTFVAALERGPVLACQFHPELSGALGLELIGRWLQRGTAGGGATC